MSEPNSSLADHIDVACTAFERAWQRGEQLRIEGCLANWTEPERSKLVRELLAIEYELQKQSGDTPTINEYRQRFPELADFIRLAISGGDESTVTNRRAHTDTSTAAISLPDDQTIQKQPLRRPFGDYELLEEIARGGMGVQSLGGCCETGASTKKAFVTWPPPDATCPTQRPKSPSGFSAD